MNSTPSLFKKTTNLGVNTPNNSKNENLEAKKNSEEPSISKQENVNKKMPQMRLPRVN